MTPEQACAHVERRLGRAALSAEPLSGGLLNHVYRVYLDDRSTVVLKHSPPYVASAPQIPLDPGRSRIEATALEALGGQQVPVLLDTSPPVLILEDLGDLPDLTDHLERGGDPAILASLARWLRALHDGPAPAIGNRSVQQTRMDLQYSAAEGWLDSLGVPDAASLGAALRALGERFLAGGAHFVMGDLWPPSVLVRANGRFVVIDWELATRGYRAQDLGHLAAHLELESATGRLRPGLAGVFLDAYGPLSVRETRETALHQGAELLARTVGAFPRHDLTPPIRSRLVGVALEHLRRGLISKR